MTPLFPDLDSLPLADQVAQMIVVRTTGHLFDHEIEYPQWEATQAELRHYLGELGMGGVILLGGSAAEVGLRSQQLQHWAKYPLLIAADIEEGVGQRFSGATWFPPPMALGEIAKTNLTRALADAESMGRYTAQEALAIGINWLLAPVVDVNNNPANPVINVRAFAETPELVSQLASAFLQGARAILTTAKHFPGHGDTGVDSHLTLPMLPHTLARLRQIELPPFQAAIAAGVDSVMTAHLLLPALDQRLPATLSAPVLSLLRQELRFDGLIVTDALVMGAITQRYGPYEAAVLAVEAGADVLLMPQDAAGALSAVCEAVQQERISAERIRASVERIWRAKQRVIGLSLPEASSHAWEQADRSAPIPLELIAQPAARAASQRILQASLQATGSLPLSPAPGRSLILVDDLLACRYLTPTAPALTLPAQLGYQLHLLEGRDGQSPGLDSLSGPTATLLQLFIRGNPFRSSAALIQIAEHWIQRLGPDLQALIIYGSPYVLPQLAPHLTPTLPVIFSYGQMPAAQFLALQTLWGAAVQQAAGTAFTD
jgi:beta-glucosidase